MYNRPGLLRRGLKCDEKKYRHLRVIVGHITPNCKCTDDKSEKHTNDCYQMEADLVLLYPQDDKVNVRLIEVKRIQSEGLKEKTVSLVFEQLEKDADFILSMLRDIPKSKINLKTFAAFPETNIDENEFCRECQQFVLSKDDFTADCNHLQIKLAINNNDLKETDINEVFSTACARMIGKETDEFSIKEMNNYVLGFEEKVGSLILLDKDQKSFLDKIDENANMKNFALKGPSGSGKTIIAMKCCNKLIDKYVKTSINKIFVYALVFNKFASNRSYSDSMVLIQELKKYVRKGL